jgi:hypothetical protein
MLRRGDPSSLRSPGMTTKGQGKLSPATSSPTKNHARIEESLSAFPGGQAGITPRGKFAAKGGRLAPVCYVGTKVPTPYTAARHPHLPALLFRCCPSASVAAALSDPTVKAKLLAMLIRPRRCCLCLSLLPFVVAFRCCLSLSSRASGATRDLSSCSQFQQSPRNETPFRGSEL